MLDVLLEGGAQQILSHPGMNTQVGQSKAEATKLPWWPLLLFNL